MSAPNPPAKTNAPAGAAPSVQPAAPVNTAAVDTSALQKALAKSTVGGQTGTVSYVDSIPSNWEILATEDPDVIDATNRVSGSTFVGTRKEFSLFIKGQLVTTQPTAN